jgi:desulfoferrodoxin (superoxide reductase-like protein)
VWAKDQTGAVVACATFDGSAAKAELVFELPASATTLTAFESCNQHGVWASEPTSV